MNIWESTVLTDKGAALQAKLVDGQTLQITRVMTGATKVPVVNLRQQTSVTDGGKEITLQPCRIEGDQMVVPVLLENKELEMGYDLWQVGIYAHDPDEGEILYCLAQASEAKHIPSFAEGPGFSITWDFCFKTSNTAPFDVNLNPVGLVNIEQYQVHTAEIGSLKSSIVNLDGRIEDLNADLLERVYPIGSIYIYIYISVSNIDPSTSFGGIWERYAKGKTLVGVDESDIDFSTVSQSGGEKLHKLSEKEIPAHSHGENPVLWMWDGNKKDGANITGSTNCNTIIANSTQKLSTGSTGGEQSHNNLQPYVTVYMWIRTH